MNKRLLTRPPATFDEAAFRVTDQDVARWASEENLRTKSRRAFAGFELVDGLDGGTDPLREVSLAILKRPGRYPQHVHRDSDALFFVVSGSAVFLSDQSRTPVRPGDRLQIPRLMPHGFEIKEGETFSFVTIQSPPIRDRKTGEEDFHLWEAV